VDGPRIEMEPNGPYIVQPAVIVDADGHVVGVNTAADRSGTNIGFAIPSVQVANVTKQITSGGTVTHTNRPYLAITTKDDATSGVDVVTVVAGGPAAKAGIQPGWVITAVGGQSVADSSALSQALTAYSPGNQVSVTVRLPDGSTRTVTVTLGERPVTP